MRGHPGHNTRPKAQLPSSFLGMDAWMTSQLKFASYLAHVCAFRHIIHGCLYDQALADVRSTSEGIICLYSTHNAYVRESIIVVWSVKVLIFHQV